MNKLENKGIYSSLKTYEIDSNIRSTISSDPFELLKYKEYFKSFVKIKKNNGNHKTYLYDMYLQSRDKYQKFIQNISNSIGFKLEGNKKYEDLPLNNFKKDYILNTINISKEMENKSLGHFKPFRQKELDFEGKNHPLSVSV